jgi:hypothetical protein
MDSDPVKFLSRPWTAGILFVALLLLIYGTIGTIRMIRRDRQLVEDAAARRQSSR